MHAACWLEGPVNAYDTGAAGAWAWGTPNPQFQTRVLEQGDGKIARVGGWGVVCLWQAGAPEPARCWYGPTLIVERVTGRMSLEIEATE